MLRSVLALVLLAALVGTTAGQPANGDLILSFIQRDSQNQISGGLTARFNPSNPGKWTTLATAPATHWHNWVRMASNNTDLVIAQCNGRVWQTYVVNADPGGRVTTISPSLPVQMDGFDLDHDDCWVACGQNWTYNYLFGVRPTTTTAQTFFTVPGLAPGQFNELAIDRDPGGPVYAIAVFNPSSLTGPTPKILHADRSGVFRSFTWAGNPLLCLSGLELHPRTGDYVTTDFASLPNGVEVNRVSKSGKVTSLIAFSSTNGVKIDQRDTAWILGYLGSIPTVLRYDLSRNAVLTFVQLPGLPARTYATGVEIYGSRPLVCRQPAGAPCTVTVNVQSRVPTASGQSYVLAASFARRPGLTMPNGEWLDLDRTGPLFLLSALDLLPPSIFRGFRGRLDAFGRASATVNIPPGLCGFKLPIFVAGVIFGPAGVVQVTNTHWFVL